MTPYGKALRRSGKQSLRNKNLRRMAFDHYGHTCRCCGEDSPELLTIDHIGEWGNEHRKECPGLTIYRWLHDNKYPDTGFQTLCMNCNWSRGIWGYCPHERKRDPEWTFTRWGWQKDGFEPIPLFIGRKAYLKIKAVMDGEVEGPVDIDLAYSSTVDACWCGCGLALPFDHDGDYLEGHEDWQGFYESQYSQDLRDIHA